MAVAIDSKLNLVIPILNENDQPVAYVHSAPIGREIFESYYRVLARTFAAIHDSVGTTAGPLVAALILRDEAKALGIWEGSAGVENGLVGEIRRLTNVVVPGGRGWETLPYDDAAREGKLDADDAAEINSALVFFTLASVMYRKRDRAKILSGASAMWGGHITSSSVTAFRDGLPTSTVAAPTADLAAAIEQTRSSIPS